MLIVLNIKLSYFLLAEFFRLAARKAPIFLQADAATFLRTSRAYAVECCVSASP